MTNSPEHHVNSIERKRYLVNVTFGPGESERLGHWPAMNRIKRVLLVTDPGVHQAGHAQRVAKGIRKIGKEVLILHDTIANPTEQSVLSVVSQARDFTPDLIVGLGGGSAMDTAKACNLILAGGGKPRDYLGYGKAQGQLLPMVMIPTTAGTGSEMQSFALISHDDTHAKLACGDPQLLAQLVILDPQLPATAPKHVTALSGIDALSHALESAVCNVANPVSRLFSRQAFCNLSTALPEALAGRANTTIWAKLQRGAAQAGAAIEQSMLGIAHSLANPLTANFGIEHGQAVGLMLPHVIRFNSQHHAANSVYRDMSALIRHEYDAIKSSNELNDAETLAQWVTSLFELAQLPISLRELDIQAEHLPILAEQASQQWTAQFNPRQANSTDMLALYEQAY